MAHGYGKNPRKTVKRKAGKGKAGKTSNAQPSAQSLVRRPHARKGLGYA